MGHMISNGSAVYCGSRLSDRKRGLQRQILIERRKLESLIMTQYENGVTNLGVDIGVLKQSHILDRLLLDIMKLQNVEK